MRYVSFAAFIASSLLLLYYALLNEADMPEFYDRAYTFAFEPVIHALGFISLTVPAMIFWSRNKRTVVLSLLAAAVGVEVAQALIPGRSPSLQDLSWSAVGVGVGTIVQGVAGRVLQYLVR